MADSGVAIWIPARLGSSRLDSKLLRDVAGRPLLAHTLDRALGAAEVLGASVAVVTDSAELAEVAQRAGVEAIRVSEACLNGSERLCRALRAMAAPLRPQWIVNLQGDEPLMPVSALTRLVTEAQRRGRELATLMIPGESSGRSVSVVTDRQGRALYFSRAVLPGRHPGVSPTVIDDARPHFGGHVGVYLYTSDVLERWLDLSPSPLELAEGLEQLRALHHGLTMDVIPWSGVDADGRNGQDLPWFSVDTAADLERLRALLA